MKEKDAQFIPSNSTEGIISRLLSSPDINGLDIRKVEDGKIEIFESGELSRYPGKYVGRFVHLHPESPAYDEFKDYNRHLIQIGGQSIILIHHFSDRGEAFRQAFESQDIREENEAAAKYSYNLWEAAAKQFFNQLEGHYCDAFLEALIVEAAKKLSDGDKKREEMDKKYTETTGKISCWDSESRAEKALKKAANSIQLNINSVNESIEFLEWCNFPIYRPSGQLGFRTRVQPQFPDYNSYIVIDERGDSIFPKGKFLTSSELYQYWFNSEK